MYIELFKTYHKRLCKGKSSCKNPVIGKIVIIKIKRLLSREEGREIGFHQWIRYWTIKTNNLNVLTRVALYIYSK